MDRGDSDCESTASPADALAVTPPVSDPIAHALVRTRVASALFDRAADPVMIGRFHVLERIGRGGMGRVYSAYDPDLDRKIALKLVPAGDRSVRERLLGEAQALARLSHPNVVPVHDATIIDDQICIVMEFVRGQTLRAWCASVDRPWREIVAVYRQVGEGLDAAHQAGLVHRDVKPDNAIVGADGRVRVVDFGLARPMVAPASAAEAAATGSAGSAPSAPVSCPAGTPRYMAPEQAAGGPVTAAADQYAFCVSLREALGGAAPWLAPALVRGTAAEPAARFPSMAALLRALGRDPAASRRRALVASLAGLGLVCAGALAAALIARGDRAAAEAPCSGGPGEIAAVWSPARRTELAGQLAGTGAYGAAAAPRLVGALDSYGERWVVSHRAACLAHRRGEHTGSVLDRRMACLARSKSSLAAAIDVLGKADAAALPGAAIAVAALPAIAPCDDVERLLASAPPPAALAGEVARIDSELARARVLLDAGRPSEARTIASAAVASARQAGYPPVLARALVTAGRAEMAIPPRTGAVAPLREATAVALRAGDDALGIEAFARRAWVEASDDSGDPRSILDGIALVEALADRLDAGTGHGAFVRMLLHNNVAAVELAAGRRDRELAALRRAEAAARAIPEPVPVEAIRMLGNLASHEADPARRSERYAATVAALAGRLGDDHPVTLEARFRSAQLVEDPARAATALAPVCDTYQRLHPGHGPAIISCWFELGWLAYHGRDRDTAVRALGTAAAIPGAEPERIAMSRGYLALAEGDPASAARAFDSVIAAVPSTGPWWARVVAGDAHLGRGIARRAAGDQPGAGGDLEAAERLLAAVVAEQPYPYIQWRLARVRAEPAR